MDAALAIVDETLAVLLKPTPITEDAAGYDKLMALLCSPADTLVSRQPPKFALERAGGKAAQGAQATER